MQEQYVVALSTTDGRRRYVTDDPLIVDMVRNLMRSGMATVSTTAAPSDPTVVT